MDLIETHLTWSKGQIITQVLTTDRVDWWGFEPQTPRVQGGYSTAELPARLHGLKSV